MQPTLRPERASAVVIVIAIALSGLTSSIIQFRRALPYANAKRALPFSIDSNNYKFFISHF
jgi:hypothetical protein